MAASRQWIHLQKQLVPQAKETTSVHASYTKNALRRQREAIEAAVKRGHLKLLNKDLILDSQVRTEGCAAAAELEHVQRISLGRCHVQALDDFDLLSCVRLRICNLESCYLNDISAFYGCVSLLKLDLTDNQITTLPAQDFWSSLSSLRVLYLSNNAISGKSNLTQLNGCPQLHILTLHNTPLSLIKNYRHHVVNSIMSLRALDSHVISDEEIIENLYLEDPFKPLSEPFRLPLYQSYPVGTTLRDELKAAYSLLLRVDHVMARYSPVMLIQRWIRGWLTRRALIKTNDPRIKALAAGKRLGIARATVKGTFSKALPSSSSSPLSTRQIFSHKTKIAAQVPTSSRSRSPRRQRRNTTNGSSTPPPPPTTPRRRHHSFSHSIETHVLGVSRETSQLKYTMHINLSKLQHSVALAEQSEPEGVSKTFKRAFVTKRRNGSAKKSEFEVGGHGSSDVSTTAVSKKIAAPKAADDDSISPSLKQSEKDENNDIELAGQTAKVLTHNQLPDLATAKREDGKALRAAEKEISQNFAKIQQPPVRQEVRPKLAGKEQHSFTRAYATMTLSALRSIERVHEARKKGEELMQKANLVSKIKQERVIRRSRIEEFQRSLRENALEWKSDESHRLEEARSKQKEQQQAEILKRSQAHDSAIESMQKQLDDQEFASEFGRQNTLVGSTLSKEDRKISKDSIQSETNERVQLAREASAEQQRLVKKYMESRKTKLIREGVERKNKLDIKVLESVTKRLMEARRKVEKENARKEAARVAIAEVKRELRCGPRGPGERRPAARGSTVRTESDQDVRLRREEHLEAFAKKQSEYTSPAHVRRMTHESHKTWQRGAEAIEEEMKAKKKGSHHFPVIPASSRSAIMYDMMAPGSILTSHVDSPLTSASTHHHNGNNSATESMVISKFQTVR